MAAVAAAAEELYGAAPPLTGGVDAVEGALPLWRTLAEAAAAVRVARAAAS